jgi:hypothetical protein
VPIERRHMPVEKAARRKQNLSARSIVPADLAGWNWVDQQTFFIRHRQISRHLHSAER